MMEMHDGAGTDIPAAAASQRERILSRPGFAWGLAFGALAVVVVVVAGVVTLQLIAISRFSRLSQPRDSVTVTATKAGKQWFDIKDGRGTLQGWAAGSSGSGDGDAYFDVATLDSVDGVQIQHLVSVNVTNKTQLIVDGRPFRKSLPAALEEDEGDLDALSEGLLTIQFHQDGEDLIADRIETSVDASPNPLFEW